MEINWKWIEFDWKINWKIERYFVWGLENFKIEIHSKAENGKNRRLIISIKLDVTEDTRMVKLIFDEKIKICIMKRKK